MIKICPKCKNTHAKLGLFCSRSCANSRIQTEEMNESRRKKLRKPKKPLAQKECIVCKNIFTPLTKGIKICSSECRTEIKRLAGKKAYNTMIRNNNHHGWTSRIGKLPSYPEKYFIDLFNTENITNYVREMPVDKWFIDFAFTEYKIALEIDGKQHERMDRKEKDKEKDLILISLGWTVFRIKWFNPRTQKGKDNLYPQIEEFKKLISS